MLLGFVHQIFDNLHVFVVIYMFVYMPVHNVISDGANREVCAWLWDRTRKRSERIPAARCTSWHLEIALTIIVVSNKFANSTLFSLLPKPWLFTILRFVCQHVTPLSQVINHHISSKSPFFNDLSIGLLHRNQNTIVKKVSHSTLWSLGFHVFEQKCFRKIWN